MKKCKLLLFDLDGTLLQSDKTISTRTLSALKKCRGNDILIDVSTSRSEQNSLVFLNELMPDILISSGGALVKYKTEYIYRAEFSEEETNVMIRGVKETNISIFRSGKLRWTNIQDFSHVWINSHQQKKATDLSRWQIIYTVSALNSVFI